MRRVFPLILTVAVLAGCATAAPEDTPFSPAPVEAPSSPVSSPSRSAAPATTGPKLVDANISELKGFAIDLGVPVVVVTTGDAGAAYHLGSHPDGSVDFTGTAVTESTRMKLRAAKVRKRTEANKNTIVIVAAPAIAAGGAESCVTDKAKAVLRMETCRPGDATQAWRVTPAGDSGLFELAGAHTAIKVDQGRITDDGWSALETTAVTS
ncbi:hypothetical protein [Paractinoplanes durhamensis]|uniref:Uncharacterized protein n=1 Tax=Paractinoplanes durhamensis TaxID=113563 RepID=A0ABQ3Z6U2_9ACTN|nr:hypothetical protein [Actinoplanes durhamensis]GIE05553.1 hypothetical protein Adu01nite_69030 [Actinoplanes durhamensis]